MTRCSASAIITAFGALAISAGPGAAERLVTSLSDHRVMVTSSFIGEQLVLFGGIEQDAASRPRRAYLAVLSNRPLDAITNAETLRRMQLGLDNIPLPQRASVNIADAASDDPFRVSFINIKREHGLYREASNGVTFLAKELFRASIPLPADVPIGTYEVDVRLFADAAQLARASSPFEVYKSGFEQVVTNAARDHGVLYGLATAVMAVATGWFASVVFRRD